MPGDNEQEWRERYRAVAAAHGRYLWLLLIAGIFYSALHFDVDSRRNRAETTLPSDSLKTELTFVGISVDSRVVRATGPFVLGLIALAALGTFPAIRRAYKETGRSRHDFEQLDTAPTAIDFAVYTTPDAPRWTRIGLAAYPAFVTLVVTEAVWLWWEIKSEQAIPLGRLFVALGAIVLLCSLLRLASVWRSEVRDMLSKAPSA
jgi:hypothetical protein